MRILVTGAAGQLGWELARQLPLALPDAQVVAYDRTQLDLADVAAIARVMREVSPEVVVNAAAYTAVDRAESEPDLAFAINAQAPGVFATEAKRSGALLIHYSTDYVFDGTATTPYEESASVNPLSVYGRSKLEGEQAVAASGCPYLILRTSWVYGLRGKNFLLTIQRLARERDELRVVNDQYGTPNWCGALAQGTVDLLRLGPMELARHAGLYHFSCRGSTTWYEFARQILGHPTKPRMIPITTPEYPLPAHRPAYAVMSTRKVEET